jgi:serine/threonine-protein kinase
MADLALNAEQTSELDEDIFVGTRYRMIRPIAVGGMSEVYLVEHVGLGTRHAAKVLHRKFAGNASLIDRLRVESQTLSRLGHQNVVDCTDFGCVADGRPFIVMEYMVGGTLEEIIAKRGPLSAYEAVAHCGNLLCALGEAHDLGVVHRDVKPGNIFIVTQSDGTPFVKLLDFGIARILPDASPAAPRAVEVPTEDNVLVGTPRYMSPEAAQGIKVDQRADLYGMGLVLYVMLTGKDPFAHIPRDTGVIVAHAFEEPKPPSVVSRVAISPELDRIVMRALSKDPDRRYASASEFLGDLRMVWNDMNCPSHLRDTAIASASFVQRMNLPVIESNLSRPRRPEIAFFASFFLCGAFATLITLALELSR